MDGVSKPCPRREDNAQVEDPFGRGQALQEDWHRQDQAEPDEDAAYPYFEVAQGEAQAREEPARFRRRLQEGSAHDSLRLIVEPAPRMGGGTSGPIAKPGPRGPNQYPERSR